MLSHGRPSVTSGRYSPRWPHVILFLISKFVKVPMTKSYKLKITTLAVVCRSMILAQFLLPY